MCVGMCVGRYFFNVFIDQLHFDKQFFQLRQCMYVHMHVYVRINTYRLLPYVYIVQYITVKRYRFWYGASPFSTTSDGMLHSVQAWGSGSCYIHPNAYSYHRSPNFHFLCKACRYVYIGSYSRDPILVCNSVVQLVFGFTMGLAHYHARLLCVQHSPSSRPSIVGMIDHYSCP